jgi:hypothetical protein
LIAVVPSVRVYFGIHICANGYISLGIYICRHMRVKICLKKRTNPSSHSPLLLDLHQCKQCGVVYHTKVKPVFSWDRQFMVDKCDVCRDFGYGIRVSAGTIL